MPADSHFQTLIPFGNLALAFGLKASAGVKEGLLTARFQISGDRTGIVFPPPSPVPARRDHLWERTCFEVFMNPMPGEAYWEFNFSPSGDWACYRFRSYRAGMTGDERAFFNGCVATSLPSATREWKFSADVSALPEIRSTLRFGLAAVIETENGGKTYWAASHRGDKADFHSRENFTWAPS